MNAMSETGSEDASPVRPSGDAGPMRQFVVFHIGDGAYALGMEEVKEIVRLPEVARVPLCPETVEGLVNLRGKVQPVLNARRLLGLPDRPHDSATRVVVAQCGDTVGLVVDRMAKVVSVNEGRIEGVGEVAATIRSDLLTGVIKGEDGAGMVMVLDLPRMLERRMSGTPRPDTATALARPVPVAEGDAPDAKTGEPPVQMVCFEVDGQEYGIEIRSVQEIVEMPPALAEVPRADPSVLGMMTLRDRLLPVVSLRRLFGMPDLPLQDQNRVAVLALAETGMSVGILLDRVREVLRVERALIDPMPGFLASDAGLRDVTAVCRLKGGQRIVSLLDPERMFSDVQSIHSTPDGAQTLEETMQSDTVTKGPEEQFVVFRLMNEEYAAAITSVQEIVRVPEHIAKVPKSPDFIDGVINLRGMVIPVVDQRRRFGLPSATASDRQRIVVLSIRGMQTGFIVDSVSEVMRASHASIEAAPDLSEQQSRMVRKVVNLSDQGRMVFILEVDELLDRAESAELAPAAA